MRFKLLGHDDTDSIKCNPKTVAKWRIPTSGRLLYGLRFIPFQLIGDEQVGEMQISLPKHIVSHLGMSLYNPYELAVKKNEIRFGPFIGILFESKADKKRIRQKLQEYSRHYHQLGGMLVAFQSKGLKKEIIKGFMFNAETKYWDESLFPYPSSILRRTSLPWDHILFTSYGDKITNQRGFDKWLVHEKLSTISTVKDYLPETVLYKDVQDIFRCLHRHRHIYVKNIDGYAGKGIIKISQENNSFFVRRREGERQVNSLRMNNSELELFLQQKLSKEQYIIQQGIALMSHNDSLIDFRLIISRNAKGAWQDFGLIGKYGKPGSIVSNISSGGKAEMGEITLKKVWKLSDEKVRRLRQRISQIAYEIVKGMETTFGVTYGDLALDLGIEKNGRVWLVEINSLGDPTIALDANNPQLYHDLIQARLLYAKKLAGFKQT